MRSPSPRFRQFAAICLVSLSAGAAVAAGLGIEVAGLVVFLCVALGGIIDWRRAMIGLLLYFPISGIPIIVLYPHTAPGALAKDFLFVIPMYIGFLADFTLRDRRRIAPPGFPMMSLTLFAVVVVVQIFNPSVPSIIVRLIGAKVWLLYIPMIAIGFHFVRDMKDLRLLLAVTCLAGLIPAFLGIVEGILEDTGHASLVYSWYGSAAAAVTQQFVNVGIGSGGSATINRVASTFSFVGQYYLFTITMVAASYGYWRGILAHEGRNRLGATIFLIFVFAGILSGARGALLFVPIQIVAMVLLDRAHVGTRILLPIAGLLLLFIAASVFGTGLVPLFHTLLSHANSEFTLNTVKGFSVATAHTIFGLGSGVDTVAARYGLPAVDPYALVGGQLQESWWVKAWLELGVLGLIAAVVALLAVLRHAGRLHRSITNPQLKAVSAGMLTLLFYILIYNFKGSFLDLDPTDVFFWLFIGVLCKLAVLDHGTADEGQSGLAPPAYGYSASPPLGEPAEASVRVHAATVRDGVRFPPSIAR